MNPISFWEIYPIHHTVYSRVGEESWEKSGLHYSVLLIFYPSSNGVLPPISIIIIQVIQAKNNKQHTRYDPSFHHTLLLLLLLLLNGVKMLINNILCVWFIFFRQNHIILLSYFIAPLLPLIQHDMELMTYPWSYLTLH